MSRQIEGKLDASGKRFGIVVSRFNELVSGQLLRGAEDCLIRHGAKPDAIEAAWVPGAFEIAPVARRMALSGRYDAVVCLGALIRGGTSHYDYLARAVTNGVAQLGLEFDIPVIFGVITCETLEQAIERSGTKAGNKGFDAAMAAIEMVNLYPDLERPKRRK